MAIYGPYDRSLRAADSDREAIADTLRDQHVAGRLDSDELQERLDRCYSARTYADLDAIVADLPHEQPRPRDLRALRLWPRLAFVPLLLIATIALSHGHVFWLAIPLVVVLVTRAMLWRGGSRRFGCAPRHGTYV
ncbi:MAG TPA: DUF1707 domain-containing protein [Solirubrobacteraceae bacterium]|nr:DUF1707 domain-containing protein [Solirubrobacteraceae bacterium]